MGSTDLPAQVIGQSCIVPESLNRLSVPLLVDPSPGFFSGGEVRLDGELIRLTPTEYNLLQQLAQSAGKLVTHRELLVKLWGQEYIDATDYLKVHVLHLRRKLGDDPNSPTMIATERGIGYKFIG